MANDERIGRLCYNLERIVKLETLISDPTTSSYNLEEYVLEHNKLSRGVDSYLAENYSGGSLAVLLDMWNYMQDKQREITEGVQAETSEFKKIVDRFVKDSAEIRARLNSVGS
jgi:hypothetical protein